ncbi:YbhB/YbcL family Raf kinase inhibitor-like protein [Lentilactobacillus kosonis]|uniref:Phospholipid-binding protein n=1 Tax=Lentilactobacillus kosonis TaxID=2810561 RepID=A0A401FM39_9LACO|nr:YbhB/YbcL family Raf kinase inhibitor-like protein [Lentilactobacillus kosonis]GAY73413.1 phospholipid-binding protein [Lentilactobacillus kosonis]
MKISVPLENGLLPDKYGKYATEQLDDTPIISFPISIQDAPISAKTFALLLIDWDAVPVSGFAWIHWVAANIDGNVTQIPENNSQSLVVPMIQGRNSTAGSIVGNQNPDTAWRYNGPQPPDAIHNYQLHVYALDSVLDLSDGFWLNELQSKMANHIIEESMVNVPSRN